MEFKWINLKSLSALSLAAMLTACGNGGGSSNSASGTDPIDKYIGSFISADTVHPACGAPPDLTLVSTGGPVFEIETSDITTKVSANSGIGKYTVKLYATSDCTGTVLNTITTTTLFTVKGSKAASDGKMVDKLEIDEQPIDSKIIAGNSITINGVRYPGDYFSKDSAMFKDIFLFDGNKLYQGDYSKGYDAEGYPLTIDYSQAVSIKQ